MNNKVILHILLVLTFIFAGSSCLSYTMVAASQEQLIQLYAANRSLFPEEVYLTVQSMLELPRGFFAACAILYLLEVVGGILMWRLRPSGLHCYAIARLLLILVPLLFIGKGSVNIGEIMFALLYILVYWMLLKQLGVFNRQSDDNTTATGLTSE
ncbi:MAG: hypothetical protein IJ637_07485 [Prevotella sp.]|nr:hypothetical protein [Prevotella sp.]